MKYFVSYAYKSRGSQGFDNYELVRDLPITGKDDIKEITEIIKKANGDSVRIMILNWRRFEQDE